MCEFYYIAFIEYMIEGKTQLDYTSLFSPNDYKKNGKIICKYFKDKYGKKNAKIDFRLKNRRNKKLFFRREKTY